METPAPAAVETPPAAAPAPIVPQHTCTAPAAAPAAAEPPASSTIQCAYCTTQLSYPRNSVYIQCPKCKNTMNPQAPHINYMHCVGCQTLLSHPPSSLTIQCPKCLVIMELPAVRSMVQSPGQASQQSMSKKQRKKRKDPNAPKRASNAYMIFCKERRAQLKEERPDLPFGQLGAKLGEMWRDLTNEQKKPFETQASQDRDRYKKAMHSYSTGLLSQADLDLGDDTDEGVGRNKAGSVANGGTQPAQPDTKRLKLEKKEAVGTNLNGSASGGTGDGTANGCTDAAHANATAGAGGLLNLALQTEHVAKQEKQEKQEKQAKQERGLREDDEADDDDEGDDDEGDEDEDEDE